MIPRLLAIDDEPELLVPLLSVTPVVYPPMAIRTQRGYPRRLIRSSIRKAPQVVHLKIGPFFIRDEGRWCVAEFAYSIGTGERVTANCITPSQYRNLALKRGRAMCCGMHCDLPQTQEALSRGR